MLYLALRADILPELSENAVLCVAQRRYRSVSTAEKPPRPGRGGWLGGPRSGLSQLATTSPG
eukprot:10882977-Lingulodinium_polyedra.AAC.1